MYPVTFPSLAGDAPPPPTLPPLASLAPPPDADAAGSLGSLMEAAAALQAMRASSSPRHAAATTPARVPEAAAAEGGGATPGKKPRKPYTRKQPTKRQLELIEEAERAGLPRPEMPGITEEGIALARVKRAAKAAAKEAKAAEAKAARRAAKVLARQMQEAQGVASVPSTLEGAAAAVGAATIGGSSPRTKSERKKTQRTTRRTKTKTKTSGKKEDEENEEDEEDEEEDDQGGTPSEPLTYEDLRQERIARNRMMLMSLSVPEIVHAEGEGAETPHKKARTHHEAGEGGEAVPLRRSTRLQEHQQAQAEQVEQRRACAVRTDAVLDVADHVVEPDWHWRAEREAMPLAALPPPQRRAVSLWVLARLVAHRVGEPFAECRIGDAVATEVPAIAETQASVPDEKKDMEGEKEENEKKEEKKEEQSEKKEDEQGGDNNNNTSNNNIGIDLEADCEAAAEETAKELAAQGEAARAAGAAARERQGRAKKMSKQQRAREADRASKERSRLRRGFEGLARAEAHEWRLFVDACSALAVLPRRDVVAVAAGSAAGRVGVWNPHALRALAFECHAGGRAVAALSFARGGAVLFSSGHDGCVRRTDLVAGRSAPLLSLNDARQQYSRSSGSISSIVNGYGDSSGSGSSNSGNNSGSDGIRKPLSFTTHTPALRAENVLLCGTASGALLVVDDRVGANPVQAVVVHSGRVLAVHTHALDDALFATAGQDGYAAVWDARMLLDRVRLHKALHELYGTTHGRAPPGTRGCLRAWSCAPTPGAPPPVPATAAFSPHDAARLLTAHSDGTVRFYDTARLLDGAPGIAAPEPEHTWRFAVPAPRTTASARLSGGGMGSNGNSVVENYSAARAVWDPHHAGVAAVPGGAGGVRVLGVWPPAWPGAFSTALPATRHSPVAAAFHPLLPDTIFSADTSGTVSLWQPPLDGAGDGDTG